MVDGRPAVAVLDRSIQLDWVSRRASASLPLARAVAVDRRSIMIDSPRPRGSESRVRNNELLKARAS